MNGQMMNDKVSLNGLTKPIMPSDLPKVRIDYKGLLNYAHNKGVRVIELSDSEKSKFVTQED